MTTKPTAARTGKKKSGKKKGRCRSILLTGYPGFIGKRLVPKLLKEEPESNLYLLVQEKFFSDAKKYIRSLKKHKPDRVQLLVGDIADMHLGLAADELNQLLAKLTDIYHLAAVSYLGVPEKQMWRVNVQGTANLLEVAEEARNLKRFNHVSTTFVSGDREGVITEDELDEGQSFRNAYEATKFEAEKRVRRAMKKLPLSVYRPSIVVGDSRTGEIGRFDGPYHLGNVFASSRLSVPLPLPCKGGAPLNMVPVDYVVDAIYHLSLDPKAIDHTFHLVDPNPMSVRKVFALVAARAGKKPPARISVSGKVAKTLLKLPGIEKLSRSHRQAIDYVNTMAFYTSSHTQELLNPAGVYCPPFDSYLDNLMTYVRSRLKDKKREEEMATDPLA